MANLFALELAEITNHGTSLSMKKHSVLTMGGGGKKTIFEMKLWLGSLVKKIDFSEKLISGLNFIIMKH